MDPIILDARSLQLADEVLGTLDVRAMLERQPFPEQPTLETGERHALTQRLAELLSGRVDVHVFSSPELETLVRCCRGSDAVPASGQVPWPHAWRYEPLFLHLSERRPASVEACRNEVAGFLLPQVRQRLEGAAARTTHPSRGGHAFPPSLFEDERRRLAQQLEALEAMHAESQTEDP
ncbi:MAG: hypothetical protein L0Y64_08050 [Myxococcaceae bacterium]|nr:hypothetical protein [Myxococcaceae bacterium]